MKLKQDTEIRHATQRNYALTVCNDGWGDDPIWIFGMEYGPTHIIHAATHEAAYEIAIDTMAPIDPSEVLEAYGSFEWLHATHPELWLEYFQRHRNSMSCQDVADILFQRELDSGRIGWPDLLEGYEHQANATGTGIVNVGPYAWLREYEPAQWPDVQLRIRRYD